MISIEVCSECRRKYFWPAILNGAAGIPLYRVSSLKSLGSWKCPHAPRKMEMREGFMPNDECPYKFEHAVAAGMKHA
jgi:hypothetical protein